MHRTTITTVVAWLIGMGAIKADGNLLDNGSFENPALEANSSALATPNSWTQESGDTSLHNGMPGSGFPAPQDGQQYISLGFRPDEPDSISQLFTVVDPGTHFVRWFDTTLVGFGDSPYSVIVLNSLAQELAGLRF